MDASSTAGSRTKDLSLRLREARVEAFLRPRLADDGSGAAVRSPGPTPATDLDHLVMLAGQVYSSAVTQETRESYARRWADFESWCLDRGLACLPASPTTLMMYLTYVANLGRSVSTLRGQAAAINRVHVEAGEKAPGVDPAAALFWRGLARSIPLTFAEQVTALRIDELRQVCRVIDGNATDPVELRDRAMLALHSRGIGGSTIARLQWSDVRITAAQAVVRLATPTGSKARLARIRAEREPSRSCPFAALKSWMEYSLHRSGDLNGVVFWQFETRQPMGKPMTPHAVNRLLRHRLDRLGDGSSPATHEQAIALLGDLHPIDLRDKAMLLLGFAGAMRRGEVTDLRWSDLRLRDGGLSCRLRRSKTDMEGKRLTTIGIPYGRSPLTCPVTAVLAWKERVEAQFGPVDPEGWVFTTAGRRGRSYSIGHDPITRETLTYVVKRRAREAGLEGHWGGRSLRAGFISTAADLDIPLESIATQSRHKTLDRLALYIRHTDPFRRNPASRIGL